MKTTVTIVVEHGDAQAQSSYTWAELEASEMGLGKMVRHVKEELEDTLHDGERDRAGKQIAALRRLVAKMHDDTELTEDEMGLKAAVLETNRRRRD